MDALPVLHFVFIACRIYEKASPHLWDQRQRGKKALDANLEVAVPELDGMAPFLGELV